MPSLAITYRRPPDRVTLFENVVVQRADECIVTIMEDTSLPSPVRVGERIVLENGSPVVWITFPGAWHDIGLFHTRDGSFTGYYANVLTPVVFRSATEWETTDLFLDVWAGTDGVIELLDEDELDHALSRGWVTEEMAQTARGEAIRLLNAAQAGTWPPAAVRAWSLQRARAALHRGTPGADTV